MKILEIIPTLKTGGAEKFVVELSNEISNYQKIDIEILQLMPKTAKDICSKKLNPRIKYISINKHPGFSYRAIIQIYKYIKYNSITHVHAHTSAISYILPSAFILKKVKFFATIHNDAELDADNNFIVAFIRKILFKSKKCIPVTISEQSELSFEKFYKMSAAMIYNGISEDYEITYPNQFPQKGLKFVHIARTSIIKNQAMLYKAFNKLINEGYDIYLYHYGRFDNDDISTILRAFENSRIKIMGETDNSKNILHYADALCLSSTMEGMPMTIIEAFSVGCPVISTPVGGCINMIQDGYNGILSEDCSFNEYYNALKRFISLNATEKMEMRANALKSFNKYNIKNTAKLYLELFHNN